MDCPKCVGKLEKKKIENIEVDVCSVCEGIWFDAGELKEVLEADAKDFDYIDVGREEFDGKELAAAEIDLNERIGKCPRCNNNIVLIQTRYEKNPDLVVDICPMGHGLWLDGGEIQKLRKRGLVNLKDWLGTRLEFLRYAFSKDGFKDFKSKFKSRKK